MGFKSIAAALAMLLSTCSFASAQTQTAVYAHFMVGIVENYTVDDWKADMTDAKAIGIDGLALNCAPERVDSYLLRQLANAYQAAGEVGFKWRNDDTALITQALRNYSSLPGQAMYAGGVIASTFVGEFFDWAPVKATLPITAIIPGPMTTVWDDRFFQFLAGKPYMMPVSPRFSTHFNSKNWVFICEQLITDRWKQVLALKPALVEIISWNNFGESHYISGSEPHHSDCSSQWVAGFPHDAWHRIMKPYITAYQAGASQPTVDADRLVYWYRPTPKDVKCSKDTLPAPNGINLLADVVFATTMLTAPATLTVTSGSQPPVSVNVTAGIAASNFTMGVDTQTFTLSRNGARILGLLGVDADADVVPCADGFAGTRWVCAVGTRMMQQPMSSRGGSNHPDF
ncbi:glycoside hydrolase [Mycena crocata]|nr:glycoside hydrolase [Mycena crocata]